MLKCNEGVTPFSATPFSRVFAVTLIFVFWSSKVVETIPIHQNVPNSHINIQLTIQHIAKNAHFQKYGRKTVFGLTQFIIIVLSGISDLPFYRKVV